MLYCVSVSYYLHVYPQHKYIDHVYAGDLRGQKRAPDFNSLELESQMDVNSSVDARNWKWVF